MSIFNITFLVLISVWSICGCKVDVQQSKKVMRRKEQTSISIPCSVNISNCAGYGFDQLDIFWYMFHKDRHYQIDWNKQPDKYMLEDQNLNINFVSKNDCGVYYCAAALGNEAKSGAQAFGQGSTLIVTERGLNVRQTLLLTLLILLLAYSLIVLGIIICIKTGKIYLICKGRWGKTKQDHSRQVIFSGVVQELYKRNLGGDKIQAHCNVSQQKAKGQQTLDRNEDIYANYDE
ncbi:immunoglobulin superfamily member 6 [Paramisgurnus dabryanus]|uniref:immunoglobulin superfamily member 6 n=1 Tax=Paramisgurnus dabryanus TaxID=90735 RepID=UPI0031F4182E